MTINPYTPPQEVPEVRKKRPGIALRFLAVGLWLMALVMIAGAFDVFNRPEMPLRRAEDPGLFWFLAFQVLLLPTVCLVVFGFASWLRSKVLAFAGLGIILLIVFGVLGIFLVGMLRRSLIG